MELLVAGCWLVIVIIIGRTIEYWLRIPYVGNITKDKYVLITGCDTGFGNKLTKQLDAKGVHVIATCLTEKGCTELNDVTSDRVMTLQMDVSSHESILKAFEEVKKIIPHERALWGVVNNAGINRLTGYLEWSTREDHEQTMAVNFFGTVDVTLTFLPLLKTSCGRLVNVASGAGRLIPASAAGGYCETKFAIEAFSDLVRRQRRLLGYQFQVSIIEPGFFATNMTTDEATTKWMTRAWTRLSDAQKEEFPERMLNEHLDYCIKTSRAFASPNLSHVTNGMEHALFSKWPKTRYACGYDVKYMWVPLSYFPAWITDRILP